MGKLYKIHKNYDTSAIEIETMEILKKTPKMCITKCNRYSIRSFDCITIHCNTSECIYTLDVNKLEEYRVKLYSFYSGSYIKAVHKYNKSLLKLQTSNAGIYGEEEA